MTNRLRWFVLVALALTTVCACSSTPSEPQGAATAFDPAIMANLQSKGISGEVALFFAATKITSQCPTDTTCIYLQTFPDGSTRQITLTVMPTRQYAPSSDEIASTAGRAPVYGFQYAGDFHADPVKIDMNYYVAKEGLPGGGAKKSQASLFQPFIQPVSAAQAGGGAGIAWGEIGKKGADAAIGGLIDAGIKGVKVGPLGSIYAMASALSDVSTAADLGKQNRKWLSELDALEKCAARPTNQVSRSDPNYSRQTVKKIQDARSELKEVNSVRFLNQMTEKFADITPVTAAMAVGLKQGFVWSEQTLGDFSENTIMREARLAVVKCEDPEDLDGNLLYEAECTIKSGNSTDHTVTRFVGNVTWDWQQGVLYMPKGRFTYSVIRNIGPCTSTTTAQGDLSGTGALFVWDDPERIKELGYGYEARFHDIPAPVTISWAGPSGCGINQRLPYSVDWLPFMRGFVNAGGGISGVAPGNSCQPGQPAKLTWNFSIPPAKK